MTGSDLQGVRSGSCAENRLEEAGEHLKLWGALEAGRPSTRRSARFAWYVGQRAKIPPRSLTWVVGGSASAAEEEEIAAAPTKVGRSPHRGSGLQFSMHLFAVQVQTECAGGRRNLNSRDIETKQVETTHTGTHTNIQV